MTATARRTGKRWRYFKSDCGRCRATTSQPASLSWRTRLSPRKPVAPVTKAVRGELAGRGMVSAVWSRWFIAPPSLCRETGVSSQRSDYGQLETVDEIAFAKPRLTHCRALREDAWLHAQSAKLAEYGRSPKRATNQTPGPEHLLYLHAHAELVRLAFSLF